jgi:hypothetical protein
VQFAVIEVLDAAALQLLGCGHMQQFLNAHHVTVSSSSSKTQPLSSSYYFYSYSSSPLLLLLWYRIFALPLRVLVLLVHLQTFLGSSSSSSEDTWSTTEFSLIVATLVKISKLTLRKRLDQYCLILYSSLTLGSKIISPNFKRNNSSCPLWRKLNKSRRSNLMTSRIF